MIEDEIRAIPLFAGLSDAGLATVTAAGVTEVESGSVLARAGDHGSGMYVVLDGDVIVDVRGGELEIGAGGFFGELTLIVPDAERVARVRASSPVRLLPVGRAEFERLLETEPSFVRALLRELASRLIAARSGH